MVFRREGSEDPGADVSGAEALQLSGRQRGAMRREGHEPMSLRRRPGLAVRRLFLNPHALKLMLLLTILPCHLGSLPARPVFDGDINQSPPSIALCKQWDLLLFHCSLLWRE